MGACADMGRVVGLLVAMASAQHTSNFCSLNGTAPALQKTLGADDYIMAGHGAGGGDQN